MLAIRSVQLGSLLASVTLIQPASAQPSHEVMFRLEAQELGQTLIAVGRQTGREIIVAADATAGKRARRLVGKLTADEAIRRLLAGTGLVAEFRPDVVLIKAPAAAVNARDVPNGEHDITVTGTRIRGANAPSPLLVINKRALQDSGKADLGEVARTLPQNFTGGQNPEIGTGATGNNQNVDASSSLNLRGLGPDATLTLLNGHRLAYDGAGQSIDLSAIPLAAVERVEIVPDGASSLYGSDAVGGVANIILRRDFRGALATARVDAPTEGGGTQQRYTLTAGGVWTGGGLLASYNFDRNDPIVAGQRDVAAAVAPSTTLLRAQRHHAAIASAHQAIGSSINFEIDASYSSRRSFGQTPYDPQGTAQDFGNTNATNTKGFAIAPHLAIDLSDNWQATLQGVYATNNLRYETIGYFGGAISARYFGCACNRLSSAEAEVEGRLFELPGGAARLAVGGGVRKARLHITQGGNLGNIDFARTRTTTFAYAETSLPFVSAQNARRGLERLSLSIAGRYERYQGARGVVSPKFGAIWAPIDAVDIKGSWGRSFKAPTLYQQYSPGFLTVLNATLLGYTGYPANSTIGILNGGNASLQPERAQTWSIGLDVHPAQLRGARFTASYFNVRFRNRVGVAVQSLFGSLGNPIYDPFIVYAPTASQVAAIIAAASGGLDNATGRPFDPSQLVAIIDSGNRNVTREQAAGVDVSASYAIDHGAEQSTTFSLDASFLRSSRIVIPATPSVKLAGTVFNPPRLRLRGGVSWTNGRLSLASFVNRIGGVDDNRDTGSIRAHGQTTVDLTARLQLADHGPLGGTELALVASNLFNDMPAAIATSYAYATPYDSTNYSAIGRTLGVQLSQRF